MADLAKEKTPEFEAYPLTRPEYIAALVHLYRGEMHRALTWRQRLDTTTNWAVFTTGALLSFLFTQDKHDYHVVGIFGILLVFFMLCYEARRFRFFDVWRSRVRKLEENFYAPLLRRDLTSPVENWGFLVAEDLLTPRFKISYLVAMRARLIRNYIPIFLVLFGAWVAKLVLHPVREFIADSKDQGRILVSHNTRGHATDIIEVLTHTEVGPAPWWLVTGAVFLIGIFLLWVGLFCRSPRTEETMWWSHLSDESVDEIS
jgi:uncharacterized membrane protein